MSSLGLKIGKYDDDEKNGVCFHCLEMSFFFSFSFIFWFFRYVL